MGRVAALESNVWGVVAELHRLQNLIAQQAQNAQYIQNNQNIGSKFVPPPSLFPLHPNLNLPESLKFYGNPSELPSFKLKLWQFLQGDFITYFYTRSQLMYVGNPFSGDTNDWYMTLIDQTTYNLPPHYDLHTFLQALADFFRGGITLASCERSLDTLRQTKTVQQLAIAYENITNTFTPQ